MATNTIPSAPPSTFTCANCEFVIASRAVIHVGIPFCCAGCVAGGPCICSYDEPVSGWQVHDCLDVTALDEASQPVASSTR